jgi:uncharacterized protein (TIGR02118 family)
MAEINVLWTAPDDVEGFERHYRDVHIPLTQRWEGVTSVSVTRIAPDPGGAQAPYHLVFRARFPDLQALQAALGSPVTGQIVQDANQLGERFNCTSTVMVGDEIYVSA